MEREIKIELIVDTSQLEHALRRAEVAILRCWWRRIFLRLALLGTGR